MHLIKAKTRIAVLQHVCRHSHNRASLRVVQQKTGRELYILCTVFLIEVLEIALKKG
jgi:hypothetical protein